MFIEKICVDNYRKLKNFSIVFMEENTKEIDDREMNVSIIVGENGTAKTTLLELLVDIFAEDKEEKKDYFFEVDYKINNKNYTLTSENLENQLPSKIIISSYTLVDKLKRYYKKALSNRVEVIGNNMNRSIIKDTTHSIVKSVLEGNIVTIGSLTEYIGYNIEGCYIEISNDIRRYTSKVKSSNFMLSSNQITRIQNIMNHQRYNDFLEYMKSSHTNYLYTDMKDKIYQNTNSYYSTALNTNSYRVTGLQDNELKNELIFNLAHIRAKLELLLKLTELIPSVKNKKKQRVIPLRYLSEYYGGITELLEDLNLLKILDIHLFNDVWFEHQSYIIPLSMWSSGELSLFVRLLELYDNVIDNSIVLIDEPETHLHPKWITGYVKTLKNLIGNKKCHVLIATHSPLIVSDIQSKAIVALRKKGKTIEQYRIPEETLGLSYELILNEVFNCEDNKGSVLESYIRKIEAYIEEDSYEDAYNLYKKLADSQEKYELFMKLKNISDKGDRSVQS